MCQYRVIVGKKRTILVSDVDKGGGNLCVEAEGTWVISVPSSHFCCKAKTVLKKKK